MNKYKKVKNLLIFVIIISIISIVIQTLNNKNNKYYYSYNASIPEINIEKEIVSGNRTSVKYDTVYKNQNISTKNDAVALIKKDSNIQKQKCNIKEIDKLETSLETKYKIEAVNLCELDKSVLENVDNVIDFVYKEFPNTKGYITNLALVNEEDTTGYIVAFMPSFAFASSASLTSYPNVKKTQVLFNAGYFLNLQKLKRSVKNAAVTGWFAKNTSVESLIAHEFGHYLSFLISMNEYKMDSILVINQSKSGDYNKLLGAYNKGKVAEKIISEAYENYKKDTGKNISLIDFRKSISEYAVATDDKGNYIYDETIGESMNDYYSNGENAKEASIYIMNVIKEKINKI